MVPKIGHQSSGRQEKIIIILLKSGFSMMINSAKPQQHDLPSRHDFRADMDIRPVNQYLPPYTPGGNSVTPGSMSTPWRRFLKRLHNQGIPWPGSILYNAVSLSKIFQQHYQLVAQDVARYGPADRILDIGTGPGRLLYALRQTFPNAYLTGVDISPAMVEQALKVRTKHPDRNIDFQIAGADNLPFDNESFDIVVSTGSIHHWKKTAQALDEIHRILKPGGRALLYDVVREMPREICQELRTQYGTFRMALLWLHSFEEPFLNADEMMALGRESNFATHATEFVGALCCLILHKHES